MIATLLLLVAPSPVLAQDLDEETDSETDGSAARKRPEVKEVVKGFYAKSSVGTTAYLGTFMGTVSAGTTLGLSVGKDFVDREDLSMAWEVHVVQGVNNGMHYSLQAEQGGPFVQGDLRTYQLLGAYEFSKYPNRRFGVGFRAGGGILMSPLLMTEEEWMTVWSDEWKLPAEPGYHNAPHPMAFGGPTIEYYSRLSHFSVGADVDVFYALGFDLGLNGVGYFKYTF